MGASIRGRGGDIALTNIAHGITPTGEESEGVSSWTRGDEGRGSDGGRGGDG